jgi:ribonuclease E
LEGIFFSMSDDTQPVDRSRNAGPDRAPTPEAAPAFASFEPAADSESDAVLGDKNSRRRRGSRGGRKRRRPTDGAAEGFVLGDQPDKPDQPDQPDKGSTSADEYDRRPADLPDSPFEGVPSAEAVRRLEGRTAQNRPRIGDTRPAQEAGDSAGPGSLDDQRSERGPRQNNSRNRKGRKGPAASTADATTSAPPADDRSGAENRVGPTREPRARRPVTNLDGDGDGTDRTDRTDGTGVGREQVRPKRRKRGGERSETSRGDSVRTGEVTARRAGTERNGRPTGRYLMCVHSRPKATQIAVLEGRSLIEHYVSRPTDSVGQIHGNIYLGRVQNVLPGMEAAFVDIGTPKNAVLYRADLQLDSEFEGESPSKNRKSDVRIEQLLKNGQMVLCQVTKNPIGSKGARLTQEVSIPGRFVVFIPNSDTYGISKRLPDDERRRLRSVLDSVRPAGHGLIVRTAAEGASADELRRDVELLVKQWDRIDAAAKKSRTPTLLHKEPDITVRVIREEFNRNYRGVVIDDRELYEEIRDYVTSITPELADRVEFHDPATEPLSIYEKHHVHEQLHKAIDRKVWLPSGGSLIIERTEALTVIDVNTGKNVGSSSLEETVFKNNLEAADEIARQLRLRDVGGIIVIDFIDMETRSNRDAVVTSFRASLSRDKTRTQVFDISELGLVEMTRKRISEGLVESLSDTCPTCEGRGFVYDKDLLSEV